MNLTSPKSVRALLDKHGVAAHKQLGQHFLLDHHTLNRIVAAAELTGTETVLEIGPGLGVMTQILAEKSGRVVGVEVDAGFVRVLTETTRGLSNVIIAHTDFLKLDLPRWAEENLQPLPAAVVANVPYYITSPILAALLETRALWTTIVVLIQKEVAARLAACPNTPDYGSLSVFAQLHATVEMIGTVPRGVFFPPPRVDSAIVRLRPREELAVPVRDARLLNRVVRAAFAQRRKTLGNAIASIPGWSKEATRTALVRASIDPQRRGETLSLEEFARLSDAMMEITPD